MSDVEHEFFIETRQLRDEVNELVAIALRSLAAAIDAQEAAFGGHDPELDEMLTRVSDHDRDGVVS